MQKIKKIIPSAIAFLPFIASAKTIQQLIGDFQGILNAVIPLLMIIATILFLWGIIGYITSAGNEEKQKEARGLIIYGLIGLFVMVSVWGLVQVLVSTFGVSGGAIPTGVGTL